MTDMAREELAEMAGLSEATVKRLERLKGKLSASTTTIASLEAALESKGITFVPGNGGPPRVRYNKPRRD